MSNIFPIRMARPASFMPGIGFGLLLLGLLMGCSSTPRWGTWSEYPSRARIAAVLARQDSYVYYPSYGIYYNRTKGQYVFPDGQAWFTQKEPPVNVIGEDLLASASVAMNFTDAPARHHAAIVRDYPRDWGRSGPVLVLVSTK